jgi:hypothetical protein
MGQLGRLALLSRAPYCLPGLAARVPGVGDTLLARPQHTIPPAALPSHAQVGWSGLPGA